MSIGVTPLEDRIIVRTIDAGTEPQKQGGLYVPDITSNRPCTGEVLAVGQGPLIAAGRMPIPVAVGDTVLYVKGRGTEILGSGGQKFLILDTRDVLAKLTQ